MHFREEVGKLTSSQRKKLGVGDPLNHYLPPTQIEVIWIQEPDFQIMIVSHFEDRRDREIIINGPFKGHAIVDEIDGLLRQPRWTDKHPMTAFKEAISPAEMLLDLLSDEIEAMQGNMLHYWKIRKPAILGGHGFVSELGVWLVAGNIADMENERGFTHALDYAKTSEFPDASQGVVPEIVPVQITTQVQCTTAYFFPPILVGGPPKLGFRELLSESKYRLHLKLREIVFRVPFADLEVMFSREGLVLVTTQDREVAMRIFDAIFGVAFLRGIPATAVRESEIGDASVDPVKFAITSSSMPMSSLRSMSELKTWPYRDPSDPLFGLRLRKVVSHEDLRTILTKAEDVFRHPNKAELLAFLLEASTHLDGSEYPQAFMMNWIIIEKHVSKLWDDFLREKSVTGKRKRKLTRPMAWSTDHYIEVLNLNSRIGDERCRVLMTLKKKRNDFMHEGGRITREDAMGCLAVAREIVEQELS